ncbi:uncharacterized protein LOC6031090 isoform X2 [Culex quinquefasciatus]|uniref:uncharacterized protein LOC6031090 isoform X2 n=1 Tax=Culex quinquefasciatus TaxID=7176 RepID=UPI0018E341A8|nr:uncharacterized protein LOC6031090 isoform X2 [Culex quinquefasciatus]
MFRRTGLLSRAQSHDNRARSTPVVPTGDNPTISRSCRQDSTADVCPSFGGRWDDNHTRVTAASATATAPAADDYFKTNLTDDKFLNECVNTACNLSRDKSKHRQLNCSSPDSDHQPGQASNSLHKSIDAFLAHEQRGQDGSKNSVPGATADQTTQQMSFTDGEYVFGPYDEHSEEFQHFNLWSSEFRQLRRNCRHQQRTHRQIEGGGGGAGSDSSSGTTLVPPQATSHDGSSCSCSVISSSDTLREDLSENELAKTPEWRQPSKQVENYDDDKDRPENVPAAGNVPPAATSYHRWVRFENGNIHPPSTPLTRVPTPYPSPTRDDEDEAIFDRFAEQLKGSRSQDQDESVGPVENVPLIDAVLDDLLTFSKSLTAADGEKGRAAAKIVEINDDNLINLLADDDNAASGATGANEDSSKETTTGKKDSAGLEKSLPSKPLLGSANSDDVVDGEKCDQNANEAQTRWDMSSEDNYLKREDIFANVAIFNWNPLDVYQHHGLFMIDPRFALADLHATTVCNADDDQTRRKTDDAHSGNGGDDTAATDGADPSSANVNSFATQRARQDGILLLESHKIPNDNRPSTGTTVDHFYDSAHVEYPVRWPDLSLSNATKECHQSPPPTPLPLVESDYDNDLAKKCNPQKDDDGEEGLKRVAWPPSAEGGDEYEQVQQQQPQQQQQQQYYQQPQQQAPAFQQYQQPAQQQPQPRERIIPIQRTTSHVSPHRTPKSPLGGGHQQPKYPQQQQQQHQPAGRVGSSTVSFSGGRPVLPQQAHPQQQHYQPAPRPVSAPYHQQVQQQQNRYSSPSTASLGSPRSPQIVGGGGHSPRGWAHVQSPVPVYRPAPQHHQQQQQQYVPAPFQTDLNPSAYHRQASAGYGPRKVHY